MKYLYFKRMKLCKIPPDLAQYDFCLLPKLKAVMKGQQFDDNIFLHGRIGQKSNINNSATVESELWSSVEPSAFQLHEKNGKI